ncbi:MAG: hypothetical protein AB1637_04280 [Elusimicrobiota bacterium]
MEQSKIEVKIGEISFHAEGEQKWITEELDKILEKIKDLQNLSRVIKEKGENINSESITENNSAFQEECTLQKFLKNIKKDVDRFLATALWLQKKEGKQELLIKDVTKALSDAKQSPLTNPSQNLGYNIKKGYCAKTKKKFYVVESESIQHITKLNGITL